MSAAFTLFHLEASEQSQPTAWENPAHEVRLTLQPHAGPNRAMRAECLDVTASAAPRPRPELAFYRKYTEAMLRRYMRLSLTVNRMPALLGHDAFRGKMSTYRVTSFEDSVIFVHDVEKCLKRLDGFSQQLIRRIAMQEYTQGEAAGLMRVSLRTVVRRYGDAVDRLTEIFLEYRLLDVDPLE